MSNKTILTKITDNILLHMILFALWIAMFIDIISGGYEFILYFIINCVVIEVINIKEKVRHD